MPLRVWFLLIVVSLSGCSGCTDSDQFGVQERPFAGQSVTVSGSESLGVDATWPLVLTEWSEQTGAEHKIELTSSAQSQATTNSPDKASTAAIVRVFPLTELAELDARGRLSAVPEEMQPQLNWLDFYKGLREQCGRRGGEPVALPISAPVLVCYFRQDLLAEAGLTPPETWAEYEKLLKTLDQWAPGHSAVEPWGEPYRATMFLARSVAFAHHPGYFSFFFQIDSGAPLIDSPGFIRALEVSERAREFLADECDWFTPSDCRREILSGRAALAIAFETGPSRLPLPFGPTLSTADSASDSATDEPIKPPENLAVGFCRLPGNETVYNRESAEWESPPDGKINRPTLAGFAGVAVGVSAKPGTPESQAAWNLVQSLAFTRLTDAFPEQSLSPCRDSQLDLPEFWVGTELSRAEAEQYLTVTADSLRDPRLVAELPVIGRNQFRAALTEQLGRWMAGEVSAKEALTATAEEWNRIRGELGEEKVRQSYLRALGLSR